MDELQFRFILWSNQLEPSGHSFLPCPYPTLTLYVVKAGRSFVSCAILERNDGKDEIVVGTDGGSLLIYNQSAWVEHLIGKGCLVCLSYNAPAASNESLTGLYVLSSTVIVVGSSSGKIFRTVDGGQSWNEIKAPALQIRSLCGKNFDYSSAHSQQAAWPGKSEKQVMSGSKQSNKEFQAACTIMLSVLLSMMYISL
eukprot:746229-Hanusia_phi.AAC.14